MKRPEFKVGEINIVCSSLDDSLTFYRDVLGFEPLYEEEGCWHMACDGKAFLLLPLAATTSDRVDYYSVAVVSFDLVVPDLNHARTYFVTKNVDVTETGTEGYFLIRDPDGLVIEIVEDM